MTHLLPIIFFTFSFMSNAAEPDSWADEAATQKIITRVENAQKKAAEIPINSAEKNVAQTEVSKGLDQIEKMGDASPSNLRAQQTVGESLLKLHEPERASRFAENAVHIAQTKNNLSSLNQALLLRGNAHLALRHYDLAEKDALLVLKTDPKNQMALSLKFASAGRVSPSSADQTAHPSIATAFEPTSSPSHPQSTGIDLNAAATRQHVDSLLREATLKSKIDPTAALPLINKALALDSNNAQIYFLRAAARRAGKDYAGALSDLDEGLRREPGSASAHAARAEISITLGRSVEEIKRDFLATGQSESNFSDYYRLQVAKLAAKNSAAHDRPHATMASGVSGYLKPLFAWQTKKKLFALTLGLILPLLLILIVRRRTSKTQSVPHP